MEPSAGSLRRKSTLGEMERVSLNQGPSAEPRASTTRFGLKSGIHAMTRGLLGPALTEIPLHGPVGDLMKRLRSKDPFTDE